MTRGRAGLFRQQGDTQVAPVELFFDLVFVFAITQLSHLLPGHLTPLVFAACVVGTFIPVAI